MIALLAVLFGGDAHALKLARKITRFVMWFSQIEVKRAFRIVDEILDEESQISRAA